MGQKNSKKKQLTNKSKTNQSKINQTFNQSEIYQLKINQSNINKSKRDYLKFIYQIKVLKDWIKISTIICNYQLCYARYI